jgi:hypothetical protein
MVRATPPAAEAAGQAKAPSCGCACHKNSACHNRATIGRRPAEAAGVEAEFGATQNTETPLEFLLKGMRDTAAEPPDCPSRQDGGAILIRSCRHWLTDFVAQPQAPASGPAWRGYDRYLPLSRHSSVIRGIAARPVAAGLLRTAARQITRYPVSAPRPRAIVRPQANRPNASMSLRTARRASTTRSVRASTARCPMDADR